MDRIEGQRSIGVGLLGCGVVGQGILSLLQDHGDRITGRLGARIDVRQIVVRDPSKVRELPADSPVPGVDANRLIEDPTIDIVVEVMGGTGPSVDLVRRAIEAGKHVVTANKALLAEHGHELIELAERRGVDLYFEAAVAGGIPIIRVLREGLASDRVVALRGIVNGTSNYILSRMHEDGCDFASALSKAQELGYAEADPFLDVGGGDAAHKLAILATLAFGARVHPRDIRTEGIDRVQAIDIEMAESFGYVIKPLAIARSLADDRLDLRVQPTLVPRRGVLASISGALNAVYLEGAMVGPCLLSGLGAGALPTAMSVVSDIVDVGRNLLVEAHGRVPSRAFRGEQLRKASIVDPGEQEGHYYLRFGVFDRPGVLAHIASGLAGHGVSIQQMVQPGRSASANETVPIVMLTHLALDRAVRAALAEIGKLEEVAMPPVALPIDEGSGPEASI